ncbi:MAG: hypothetical protein K9M15_02785 [Candidatus Marinimicrobia bacterium]|nr:hypothetical protein [Candidatus Neomarinimicrobiota bacterium]
MQQKLIQLLKKTIVLLTKQVELLSKQLAFKKTLDKNEFIYQTAKSLLGKKLRTIGKELACANVLNMFWEIATGKQIGGKDSTSKMFNSIRLDKRFREVKLEERKAGDICISPTGFREFTTRVYHGHCWILGKDDILYSNNSETGLFDDHWTVGGALRYYKEQNGFIFRVFRAV